MPNYGLTCHFTLQADDLSLGVSFQSADGGKSYGGAITIQTPATAGPVVTGLWDSDGNVFFTIYLADSGPSGPNCVLNSGSVSGTFDPDVQVFSQNGLQCEIVRTGEDGQEYWYTLEITQTSASDFAGAPLEKTRPQPVA